MIKKGTKYLAQLVRKCKFVDFFTQDIEALGEIEGVPEIIDKGVTNEELQIAPYIYVYIPSLEIAKRILERSVLIKSLNIVFGEGTSLEEAKKATNREELMKHISGGSIAFKVDSINKSGHEASYKEVITDFMKEFDMGGMEVNLKNPKHSLKLVEIYKPENTKETLKGYFAVEVMESPSAHAKYSLSERPYLGPTSTDHQLAYLMANQGLIKPGTLVYDPFCGTCGILLICAHLGGVCWGSDLDIRVLKGMGVARVSEKMESKIENGDVFTNYDFYHLPHPDILRMDFTQPSMRAVELFDVVICDPPYGIRAASKKFGKRSKKDPKLDISEEEKKASVPATVQHRDMYKDVLENAARYVRMDGRLVILFPTCPKWEPEKNILPKHTCFQLMRDSKNNLTGGVVRHMLTYKKVVSYKDYLLETMSLEKKIFKS